MSTDLPGSAADPTLNPSAADWAPGRPGVGDDLTVPDVITTPPTSAAVPLSGLPRSAPEVEPDLSDLVSQAALGVAGVDRLHGGAFGEVATYLPGRRVAGVRLGETTTEVHVVIDWNAPAVATAEAVRAAVEPLVGGRVDITVEDVAARR